MRYLYVSCILAIMMVLIRQQIISTADTVEVNIAPPTMSLAFPPPPPPPPPPPWDDDDIAYKTHTLESMPRFPGCENTGNTIEEKNECSRIKLLEYIRANLQYPLLAKQHGIQGRSVVQFIIETDGTISTIQCVRRLGYGIDEEAVRIIESMNQMQQRWTPGTRWGTPVKAQFTLPISFRLVDVFRCTG